MRINIGTNDRLLRVLVGAVLLILALGGWLIAAPGARWLAGLAGALLLVTGALRFCPAYKMLGVSTDDGK
ncbi:MAG: DUF2892 domain-containing protein [Paracoccus sp. (in: a-proteobacteria)]|nr:DUF2892 domain-containing protein [Paracoccus sp. (in: a-proteobacteria)]